MKKFILFAAILFAGVSVVSAEGGTSNPTGTADLLVRLNPIHTISVATTAVDSEDGKVLLEYTTNKDYSDGVKSYQENHLTITSTGAFNVTVSATPFVGSSGNTNVMPLTSISLLASETDKTLKDNTTMPTINLSSTDNLISSTMGGFERKFNVNYDGIGGYEYMKNYFKTGKDNEFETTVTYTLLPQ